MVIVINKKSMEGHTEILSAWVVCRDSDVDVVVPGDEVERLDLRQGDHIEFRITTAGDT